MRGTKAPLLWRIDIWLLLNIFAPIAHEVDRRFHINHYRLAAYIFTASAFLVIIDDGIAMEEVHAVLNVFLTVCAIIICMVRYDDIKKMTKLSAALERNPDKIPIDAIPFILPYGRWMYLMGGIFFFIVAILGFVTTKHSLFYAIVSFIAQQWFLTAAIAYYIAALPPSPHKRVEKKARDWSFGLKPAFIGTK